MKWLIAAAVLWWICCRKREELTGPHPAAGTSASGLLPQGWVIPTGGIIEPTPENPGPLSYGNRTDGVVYVGPPPPGSLELLAAIGRAEGRQATAVTRRAIYGTRLYDPLQADRASSQQSAIGIAPPSVWGGPRFSAEPGAPICRRAMR